jgi:hypothetical protein
MLIWVIWMTSKFTTMLLLMLLPLVIHTRIAVCEEAFEKDFRTVSDMYHKTVQSGCLYFEFSYQTVNPVSGTSVLIAGKIWLHADQFRLEAEGNLFIRNDLVFYQVFNRERQILIDSGAATENDLHPAGLLSQLESHFEPSGRTLLADGSVEYALEPLGSDWLLEAGLTIHEDRIRELRLLDINSTQTVIQIDTELREDTVADSLFQLSPRTSDYETIDLRGSSR